jgi:hypothetical protein
MQINSKKKKEEVLGDWIWNPERHLFNGLKRNQIIKHK